MGPMQPAAETRFYRGSNRVLGGVCSGLAESLHVDPLWIRLAFVVLALIQGGGILVYLVLWIVMPERPADGAPPRRGLDELAASAGRIWGGSTNAALWTGIVLIGAGIILLAANSGLVRWEVLWPVIVIVLGGLLLARSITLRR